jgi:hypothetical protein
VTFTGVLQTGDIDEALECAQEHVAKGEHILVSRHEYKLWPEELEKYEEYRLSDGHFGHPLEHDAIEYEVWVDMD